MNNGLPRSKPRKLSKYKYLVRVAKTRIGALVKTRISVRPRFRIAHRNRFAGTNKFASIFKFSLLGRIAVSAC